MKRGGYLKRHTPLRKVRLGSGKKGRKISAAGLKKKLWAIFSAYIRRRDADPQTGMVKCVSCPTVKHWKEMDCGHYIPKSLGLAIYFEERNCAAQCQSCNLAYQGNQYPYALALLSRYGTTVLEELDALRRTTRKISTPEYLELIERYKSKLADLDKKEAA